MKCLTICFQLISFIALVAFGENPEVELKWAKFKVFTLFNNISTH